jgi:Tol biopolymer transport system component
MFAGLVSLTAGANPTYSYLSVYNLTEDTNRTIYESPGWLQAPSWTPDDSLIYNVDGDLYRIPVVGSSTPEQLPTGPAGKVNNDHVLSPDGKSIALSSGDIWILPMPPLEGEVVRVTNRGTYDCYDPTICEPSYAHGWSPDGGTIAYCAARAGKLDVYTAPVMVNGSDAESKFTTFEGGYNDGPDYSADGKDIYICSNRTTGVYQIWKAPAEGGEFQQLTFDTRENWFPHPSPDGRWIAYVSYPPGVTSHDAETDVELRLLDLHDLTLPPRTLVKLFGGQGTINVIRGRPTVQHLALCHTQGLS